MVCVIVLTTTVLLRQAQQKIRDYLGIEPGVIGAGQRRPGPMTVALVQSLARPSVDLTPLKYGTLIFDEGHRSAAPQFLDAVKRLSPRYSYYLSAVPFRSGHDQNVLDALTGGPLTDEDYSAEYLISKGYACPAGQRCGSRFSGRSF